MAELYWSCVIGGVLFAFVTIIFGDVIGNFFDGVLDSLFPHHDFLQPMVVCGAATSFGGAGILLSRLTSLGIVATAALSFVVALIVSVAVFFLYVKPMKEAENSTGFSIQDLIGKIGVVIVTVPATGCGEVMIRIGAGNTNQIAASFDKKEIKSGTRVVVAEVRDGVLYVFRYED
jgi:membrane protein implicated in regulation of membrane protease activity